MELIIEESIESKLLFDNNCVRFLISNYSELANINSIDDMFKYLVYNDKLFKDFDESELNTIHQYITGNISRDEYEENLQKKINIIWLLIDGNVENYKRKYEKLLNIRVDGISVLCNKKNLNTILSLNLPKDKITLINDDITFRDFYDLLSGLDLKKHDDFGTTIRIKESSKPLKLSRLYNIVSIVKSIANKIENMHLSNLEKIIYVYDILKERIYKENESDYRSSRDIDDVILGECIVCVGFARLINVLLSFFDINAIQIRSKEKNHRLSLVYIKDDKYGINGFVTLNLTSDCKTNSEDKKYINRYSGFGTSLSKTLDMFPNEQLQDINISFEEVTRRINCLDEGANILHRLDELSRMIDTNDYEMLLDNIINFDLLNNAAKDRLKSKYEVFRNKLFNTSIDMSTFIKALYNTRRIEYYIGMIPEIDIDDIKDSSVNWKMFHTNESVNTKQSKFFFCLGAYSYLEENGEELITSSLNRRTSVEEDVLDVRLLKVLKRRLNNMQNK